MNSLVIRAMRQGCTAALRKRTLLLPASTSREVAGCPQSTVAVPVVAGRIPRRVKVTAGKRYAWCACGHSKKQPFCDGAHRTEAPGIPPVRFTPDKDGHVTLCACKQTSNRPYCDGTHFKVIYRDVVKSVKKLFKS